MYVCIAKTRQASLHLQQQMQSVVLHDGILEFEFLLVAGFMSWFKWRVACGKWRPQLQRLVFCQTSPLPKQKE